MDRVIGPAFLAKVFVWLVGLGDTNALSMLPNVTLFTLDHPTHIVVVLVARASRHVRPVHSLFG